MGKCTCGLRFRGNSRVVMYCSLMQNKQRTSERTGFLVPVSNRRNAAVLLTCPLFLISNSLIYQPQSKVEEELYLERKPTKPAVPFLEGLNGSGGDCCGGVRLPVCYLDTRRLRLLRLHPQIQSLLRRCSELLQMCPQRHNSPQKPGHLIHQSHRG